MLLVNSPQWDSGDSWHSPQRRPEHRWHRLTHWIQPPLVHETLAEFAAEPSDLLLDPFHGSGTALVAAMEAGGDSIGDDLSPLSVLSAVRSPPAQTGVLARLPPPSSRPAVAGPDGRRYPSATVWQASLTPEMALFSTTWNRFGLAAVIVLAVRAKIESERDLYGPA